MSAQGMTQTVLATGLIEALAKDYPNWPPMYSHGAVQAWIQKVAAQIADPAPVVTRHTHLGELPVDVNSIDRLDRTIGKMGPMIADLRDEVAKLRSDHPWGAVRYAKAHAAYREAKKCSPPGDINKTIYREWLRARKIYEKEQQS